MEQTATNHVSTKPVLGKGLRLVAASPSASWDFRRDISSPSARLRRVPPEPFAGLFLRRVPGFAEQRRRRVDSSPSANAPLRRVDYFAECLQSRQTSCQMVTWEVILPSPALGKVSHLGEASSQVTIWHLEHLFTECQTRQRRLRLVPHSAKSPQFSTIFLFFLNPCISKHNICIYFQI